MNKEEIPSLDILDNMPEKQEETVSENYQFADGYIDPDDSLSEFLEDFRKPKEETGVAEQPEDDEDIINVDEDELSTASAQFTAQFIVDAIDEVCARGLAFYSLNPVEEHRAGKEQKKHLKRLWTQLCKEKNMDLPVGWQITIAMSTIYASQLPKAYQDRKANLRLEHLKEDEERLKYDRMLLERERKLYESKRA